MEDPMGLAQSSAVLGRALVLGGRVAEGLSLVDRRFSLDGGQPSWDDLLGALAMLAAAVQVGDVEKSERLLSQVPEHLTEQIEAVAREHRGEAGLDAIVASTEMATTLGLHRIQVGDVVGAVRLLQWFDEGLPELDPNLRSALALAHVACGETARARIEADAVDDHWAATYLDRLTGGVARGLALARDGEAAAATAAFDQLRAAADATEDRVSQALVRLAGATAASALGEADAARRMADADARLAELGLQDTAWRRAYSQGLGLSSAT